MNPITRFPLRLSVPLLFLCAAFIWTLYSLHHDGQSAQREVDKTMHLRLDQQMSNLQHKLEHLLSSNDETSLKMEFSWPGAEPYLQTALLADEQGKVLYATHEEWVGHIVEQAFPEIRPELIVRAKNNSSGVVVFNPDHSAVMGYQPIILATNGTQLNSTHVGTLFMQYDLTQLKAAASRDTERQVFRSSLFLVGFAAALALLFHFILTRRVARLVSATKYFAAGNLNAKSGLQGSDEISRIGQAFDLMTDKITEDSKRLKLNALLLEHQALHDKLTELPNRNLLEDRLQQGILSSARGGKPLALLIMDLDGFKDVNDSLGHHAGDDLLKQIGQRLQVTLRKTDTVARLGGDEFGVLLHSVDAAQAEQAARKLLEVLEAPFQSNGHCLKVGVSIGIALFPEHGANASDLMRHADVAMYAAKHAKTGCGLYNVLQDQDRIEQLALARELNGAMENNHLLLYYQPKVDCRTGQVVSAEALLRWQHPQLGLLPPDKFIPLAERTGSINALTLWMFKEALQQCASWRQQGINISVALNLSACSLPEPQIFEQIADILAACKVSPTWLELEITESTIMTEPARAMELLMRLDALGIRLTIDDFGTGYSSLTYLKKLPVDAIKIDKSFVMSMLNDTNDAVIVRSTIELAHNLDMKVTAEGVESQETWDLLVEYGCDMAQGYFISSALTASAFTRWLANSRWGKLGVVAQVTPIKSRAALLKQIH